MPARRPLRITFIGRYTEGATGVVRSLFLGLHEQNHVVQEVDVGRRGGLLHNPEGHRGGHGPVYVRLDRLAGEILAFRPDLILLAGGGLTFSRRDLLALKRRAAVVAITFSDPDVYPTVSRYAGQFTLHATNSLTALRRYREAGNDNTVLLPFAVDSRFFVPRPPVARYRADVAVIGHATPERIAVAKRLAEHFSVRFHGRGWPLHTAGSVRGEDWFRAAYSARCLVNFPRTRAGYLNVKVGVFEGTATGRLVFTEYFDEMRRYFKYGEEIVGYEDVDDLIRKLHRYLERPAEAAAIARAGQVRCAYEHTWNRRLDQLLSHLRWPAGSRRAWPALGSGPALRVLRRRPRRLQRRPRAVPVVGNENTTVAAAGVLAHTPPVARPGGSLPPGRAGPGGPAPPVPGPGTGGLAGGPDVWIAAGGTGGGEAAAAGRRGGACPK